MTKVIQKSLFDEETLEVKAIQDPPSLFDDWEKNEYLTPEENKRRFVIFLESFDIEEKKERTEGVIYAEDLDKNLDEYLV